MYGLPKDFDPSPLIGKTLDMVCFNVNQIYLHFDGAMIAVSGNLTYQKTASGMVETLSPPVIETNLMELVGHEIKSISAKPNGTLSLIFDNGAVVECLDSSSNYESYQITMKDKVVIV